MSGRRFWQSLEELDSEGFGDTVREEFPSLFDAWFTDRRELLRVMGASLALAGLAGCGPRRSADAIPFVDAAGDAIEEGVRHYATAVTFEGYAQPVIATAVAGRPIKLEGNPDHPASCGASSLFTQAAILDLYDPDRSQAPLLRGAPASWDRFDLLLARLRREWRTNGGAGLRILTGPTTSPTLIRQFGELGAAYPNARIHLFQPAGGVAPAFERPAEPRLDLSRAEIVVSLDADLLGPAPAQVPNMRAWATRRGEHADRSRLLIAETTPTQTGAAAVHRLAVAPSRLPLLAAAIAFRLGAGAAPTSALSPGEAGWCGEAAHALDGARGRSLLAVGAHCPPQLHALAFAVNRALRNVGATFDLVEPIGFAPGPGGSLQDLADDLAAGRVGTLLVLDSNPAYAAPADLDFPRLYRRAALTIHAGLHADETAALSDWHLPLPHALEEWSDARAIDGTATLIQPLVDPLYDTRSVHGLVAALTADQAPPPRELVRATWQAQLADDAAWGAALRSGIIPGTAAAPIQAEPAVAPAPPPPLPQGEVEIVFRPDPTIWDGRFANNGWLQELGKPLFKVTWENVVAVSPALARALELANGDHVRVESGGRAVEGPAWILPGQPERVVTLFLGYGRRNAGRVGNGIGYDAYRLRTSASPWASAGTLTRLSGRHALAVTQLQQRIEAEGEDLVRTVSTRREAAARPEEGDRTSFYTDWPQEEPAWGMVIDLDLCTGCNACAIACQAENNVPVVGKDQVGRGRQMHWLRIDRYYAGDADRPETMFQPVPCMHCEQAPCEMGCPVHATVHSPDGLNEMVYNRCIGTRTCSSYCPYKVRRFNWFDYTSGAPESVQAQRNPDVTVRGRGVMEKCTYCVQRIRGAAVQADIENRPIREGEVVTACQQACPSGAITFGNIRDPASAVARLRGSARNYALLGELGTRPRTTYLARLADREGEA